MTGAGYSRDMLSAQATLLLTWAAIFGFIAAFHGLLFIRRRSQREYLWFAGSTLALTVWAVAGVLEVSTGATLWLGVGVAAGIAVSALGFHLATELVDRYQAWRARVYLVAVPLMIAAASGLLVETTRGSARLNLFGYVAGALGVGLGVFSAHILRHRAETELARWAAGAMIAALLLEELLRMRDAPRSYLGLLAAMLPTLAVVLLLLRRFLRDSTQLAEATTAVRNTYRDLRLAQEELVRREQLAAVGELSAVIAHEVRNPLAIIKNAGSSLRRPTLRPEDRTVLLGILDEEVDRLNRLAHDLLSYSRPVMMREWRIDPVELVNKAVERRVEQGDSSAVLTVDVEDTEFPVIQGDPDLLRQAVNNIIDNAVQAMRDGGELSIRATVNRGQQRVVLEFVDDGPGMNVETLERARSPFFTTRAAGTGLGLAIVDRVIATHGGAMEIGSAPDLGTTVTIELPFAEEAS